MAMRYWIFPLITIFSLAAVLGAWHSFDMGTQANGEMSGCLFMGNDMLCRMSITEHIASWQSVLTALPHRASGLLLVIFLAAVLLFLRFAFRLPLIPSLLHAARLLPPVDHYIADPLIRAFARGILHPKIYDAAR
ncbi:MAG: hypothetical protein Q8R35_03670 [bacterium]|nr:hypothetical protein [bacterium]